MTSSPSETENPAKLWSHDEFAELRLDAPYDFEKSGLAAARRTCPRSGRRPSDYRGLGRLTYSAGTQPRRRSIIIALISEIALAGFRCFGQVWAQFMIVWQR